MRLARITFSFITMFSIAVPLFAELDTPIGVVLAVSGEVTATNNGVERKLQRRSELFVSDVLKTNKDATAQLRFKDNSLLTLKNEAALSLDKYSSAGDSQDSFQATLNQGTLRTKTGAISKRSATNYGIRTPVGVMGVRGTFFKASYDPRNRKLAGSYFLGSGSISNEYGTLLLGQGLNYDFGEISDLNAPSGQIQDPISFEEETDLGQDTTGDLEGILDGEESLPGDYEEITLLTDEELAILESDLDMDYDLDFDAFDDFDFDDTDFLDDFVDEGLLYAP